MLEKKKHENVEKYEWSWWKKKMERGEK